MKKKFLGIIAVFLLSVFIIPSKVFAADGKTFTINMPNDFTNTYSAMKDITVREYFAFELVGDDNEIISPVGTDEEQTGYEYKKGKNEKSTIDITNEMREASVDDYGRDIFEGYSKISIKLFTPTADNSKEFVVDFSELSSKDYLDVKMITYEVAAMLSYGFVDSDAINKELTDSSVILNKDNKVLATLQKSDGDWEYIVSDDVTADDDIVYNITEDDKEELAAWLAEEYDEELGEFNYTRFIYRFSDKEYDETDYVYDFDARFGDIYEDFFIDKLDINNKVNQKNILKNADGKDLVYYYPSIAKLELAPNVSVKDNFTVTLKDDDEFTEFLKEGLDANFEKASFKFKKFENYKVLDGAKQKFDVSSKKALTFRFDIDFDIFKKSGKVYMDGKLVDAKNYTTKSGSTIITFNDNYTNTLTQGNHTLKVTTDEGEATTTFTITDSVNNPNTGDNILMYVGLLSISVGSILVGLKLRKRFN